MQLLRLNTACLGASTVSLEAGARVRQKVLLGVDGDEDGDAVQESRRRRVCCVCPRRHGLIGVDVGIVRRSRPRYCQAQTRLDEVSCPLPPSVKPAGSQSEMCLEV